MPKGQFRRSYFLVNPAASKPSSSSAPRLQPKRKGTTNQNISHTALSRPKTPKYFFCMPSQITRSSRDSWLKPAETNCGPSPPTKLLERSGSLKPTHYVVTPLPNLSADLFAESIHFLFSVTA